MSCNSSSFPEVASFTTADALNDRLAGLGLNIRADRRVELGPQGPMHEPIRIGQFTLANRWCIQPLNGSDATAEGRPTDLTRRRWLNFGASGAKLIWGCESVAVRQDGRLSPNQLLMCERNVRPMRSLRELLLDEHNKNFGRNGVIVGLQLTHAGRFARPKSRTRPEPKLLHHHPILDRIQGIDRDARLVDDNWIDELIEAYVAAAQMAADAGFDMVDISHGHGGVGHELLCAHTRPGPFGGSFENRTLFLRRIVEAIRRNAPKLMVGVRLSAYDVVPHIADENGVGRPADYSELLPYRWGFGMNQSNPREIDLSEPLRFVHLCRKLGVAAINVTAGSHHYSPHIQRPSAAPAEGDYGPPEDPLAGVCRMINVTADLKRDCPDLAFVGSGFSYLQDYLPNVAQWAVANHKVDLVGLGRMALCYWDLPADLMTGRPIQTGRICRTLSQCVTAARRGLVSGCFSRNEAYRASEQGQELRCMNRGEK